MMKILRLSILLIVLLMTPLTVFAVPTPTANVSLLGSGPGQYNFEFENTTSNLGYDIYEIDIWIPSDPAVFNFRPPNPNSVWEVFEDTSGNPKRYLFYDTTPYPNDHSNMILSGCSPICVGYVSFDTSLPVSEFSYTIYFTDPDPQNSDHTITGNITSVPESSSLFLLSIGIGIICILGYLRRFNRKTITS